MTVAKNPIKTSVKTLTILDALSGSDGARITELADELGYTKGTVHHHLSTLEEHEYVVKRGGKYHLGMRVFQLGEATRQEHDLYEVAKPELDKLADKTGELANLMIEEHGRGYYLYIARGDEAINLDTKIGTRQYLHSSALGKVILAHLPKDRTTEIIDRHGLVAQTPNTVTDRDTFWEILDTVAENGVAFDGEERAEGIRCVAAPITDNDSRVLGAVSVSGPASRLKGTRFRDEIPELVKQAATVIGINVSYL
ncbi:MULTISPECIES: IclR family transcriptional regulator [Salinibaculum]|uniref:IclR family transcriptional regulator n=1 Tax=Salinibaculum TaxID=2732368 RepID=UPI0030CF47B0